jgi:hypothetical protein
MWHLVEISARGYAVVRISNSRIIDIATDYTNVFFHHLAPRWVNAIAFNDKVYECKFA